MRVLLAVFKVGSGVVAVPARSGMQSGLTRQRFTPGGGVASASGGNSATISISVADLRCELAAERRLITACSSLDVALESMMTRMRRIRGPKPASASIAAGTPSTQATCAHSRASVSRTPLCMTTCRPTTTAARSAAGSSGGSSSRGTPVGMRNQKRLPCPNELCKPMLPCMSSTN